MTHAWQCSATVFRQGHGSCVLGLVHYRVLTIAAVGLLVAPAPAPAATVTTPTESAFRTAMSGGGFVNFACDGTIVLSSPITNVGNTIVDAAGHSIQISGNHAVQVFYVPTNTSLALLNLTVTGAASTNGGAVYVNGGVLNATNCTFSGNTVRPGSTNLPVTYAGGAISIVAGEANLQVCRFTSNSVTAGPQSDNYFANGCDACGGAIYNAGTLRAVACTFSSNSVVGGNGVYWSGQIGGNAPPAGSAGSGKGGAIGNLGSLFVYQSLFCGNVARGGVAGNGASGMNDNALMSARGQDGGNGGNGYGGAVASEGAVPAVFVNSTFSGNQGLGSAGGAGGLGSHFYFQGIYYQLANGASGASGNGSGAVWVQSAEFTNCTVVNNFGSGSPLGSGGFMTSTNSNAAAFCANTLIAYNSPRNAAAPLSDGGHNLSSDDTCAFTASGSLNNTAPALGPLADNGGPTLTVALLIGSVGIDAADPALAPSTDERGFPRPVNGLPDIGAYELGLVPPSILVAPTNQTASIGITVHLTVIATGFPAPAYQWFFNSTNRLSGGTGSTLDLPNVQLAQAGAYSVTVSNAAGITSSPPALLTVLGQLPHILSNPADQNVELYSNATFSVTTSGSFPQMYQWYFNSTNGIAGGTDSVLQISSVQFSNAGSYSVRVTNAFGSVTSSPALLNVYGVPPQVLSGPTGRSVHVGASVDFVVQVRGSVPLAYQWYFNSTAPIPGATAATLHLSSVQITNSGTYSVRVTNAFGSTMSPEALLAVTPPGTTAIIELTDTALRSALNAGGSVIFAVDGVVTLTGPIQLQNSVTLDGNGHRVAISGGHIWQMFNVPAGLTFGLANLTIRDGDAASGAALYINGQVNATNCVICNNLGNSCVYGAVYNGGMFVASACTFSNNSVRGSTGGAGTGPNPPVPPSAGGTVGGGAIFSTGFLSVERSLFVSNSVTGGQGGHGGPGDYYACPTCYATSGGSGGGAYGAAVGVGGGTATIRNCTFAYNGATGGQGGTGGTMSGPDPYATFGPSGGYGGDAGGALYVGGGQLALVHCTIACNSAVGGRGGEGGGDNVQGAGGDGGDAVSSLYISAGSASVINCLIASNSCVGGTGGYGCHGPRNNIQCGNSASGMLVGNFLGPVGDLGHNLLSSDYYDAALTNSTSIRATNSMIGVLSDNGGPSLTIPLLFGSPAIDAGDAVSSSSSDQRGLPRPIGPAPDIGAFEFGWPGYLRASLRSPAVLDLMAVGVPNQTLRFEFSTDLRTWSAVATNQLGPDGLFHLLQPAAGGRAFYRLKTF